MHIWSYSIFGRDTEKYYKPMIKNFELAKKNNMKIIINVNKDDENFLINYFADYKEDFILEVHDDIIFKKFPKMLRYTVAKKYQSSNFFYKDSDSIVTDDELNIMNSWLENEEKDYLIIRNHPVHVAPILAGMFAVRFPKTSFIVELAQKFFDEAYIKNNNIKFTDFDYDQVFLQKEVYLKIKEYASIYSSHFYFCEEDIIKISFNMNFIGKQVYKDRIENGDEWYYKLYGNDMLCIPYIKNLYQYYKSDRMILLLSKLFKLLSLKMFSKRRVGTLNVKRVVNKFYPFLSSFLRK